MIETRLRPQLSEHQVAYFRRESVLRYSGEIGSETAEPWNPIVQSRQRAQRFAADYVVDQNSPLASPNQFHTVQAAVNQAVLDVGRGIKCSRIYIDIAPGDYEGLLYVPRLQAQGADIGISIRGTHSDPSMTRLHANIDAQMRAEEYRRCFAAQFADAPANVLALFDSIAAAKAEISTANASVLRIENCGFQAFDLTVQNTYNADRPEGGEGGDAGEGDAASERQSFQQATGQHQAVALLVAGADKVYCQNVRLKSFQDTLYLRSPSAGATARSCFHRCDIEGDVDFIFGQAVGYFQQCTIRSLGSRAAHAWVAAPSTHLYAKYGFVFDDCDFVHDGSERALQGRFSLGRQWFEGVRATPYGVSPVPNYRCDLGGASAYQEPAGTISKQTLLAVGKCVILNSRIAAHINPAAPWDEWNGGSFRRDGRYQPGAWSPRFRPVQASAGCLSKHLHQWFVAQGWRPSIELEDDVLLAEYNNRTA